MSDRQPFDPPEVAPIRAGEEFDEPRVDAWVREHVQGLEGPMQVRQFPGGHANLTYLLRFGEREIVMRRPPLGPVAPRSHDMSREYKVLSRLGGHFEPAPRAYALCEDLDVLGAVFILMERCRGIVIRARIPAEVDRHPDGRRRACHALIDTMADFHGLDYEALGLGDLGKPEGFALRQVEGWYGRWERAKDREQPRFEDTYHWLVERLPTGQRSSLVHNDLKFDNVMLDPEDPGRVTAILDWDMTTLGDPLVDLGTLLGYWPQKGDPPARGNGMEVTAQEGMATRRELAERYAERTGADLAEIPWYETFAIWKTAVVLQQIYIRYVRGQTRDERFQGMGPRVEALIDIAADLAEGS